MRRLLLALLLTGPPTLVAMWSTPVVAQAGPALAVAPFANQTGDPTYDALGVGLADMLISDLSGVEQLTLVERGRLQDLLDELALADSTFIDASTAATIGRGLGARYVLTGAVTAVAPQMRLDARVIDVESGEIVHTSQSSGPTDEFFLLEKELASGLADGLGITLSARERARLGRVQTESFAAFQAYGNGLAALDRGQLDAAADALQAALAADDRFDLATAALDGAQAALQAAGAASREVRTEAAQRVLDGLRALPQDGTADPDAVGALVDPRRYTPQLPLDSQDLFTISGAVLDLGLPDDAVMDLQITKMALNEWALAHHTLAALYLKRRADVLTYGQALLERYPMTSWAQSVQTQLQSVIDELRKIEAGQAELPLLRQQAQLTEAVWTCTAEGRPEVAWPACQTAWTVAADLDPAVVSKVGLAVVEGALHAGEHDQARAIGAQVAALPTDPEVERHNNRIQSELGGLDRNLADIEKRKLDLASAKDGGRYAALAARQASVGWHEHAAATIRDGLERFPDDVKLLEQAVGNASLIHDKAAADGAMATWQTVTDTQNSRHASAWRRIDQDISDAGRGRARALSDLANDLNRRALYGEAGDAWLALAREELAFANGTEDVFLIQAGWNYAMGGRNQEARALFEEIIDRFGGTQSADSARLHLQSTPR